jgi:hypothetical protein
MRLILLTGALLLTAACGQKGPLYMPIPGEEEPPAGACRACPPLIMPAPADGNGNGDSTPEKKSPKKATTDTPTAEPQESTP